MSGFYPRRGKRWLDVVGAACGLLVTAPAQTAVAIEVRRRMGSPILFRQQRPGLDGAPFTMLKFRTMLDASDSAGRTLPDAERLTQIGRWLRETSLDELPELWNVLRGDMSLVGPRPLLMEYLDRYTPEQARRHDVRPGVTGWAQINGRNSLSWEEKFALDVWYVDHRSLAVDLRILWKTIRLVVHRVGISSDGHATAPEFAGRSSTPGAKEDI